MGSHIPFMIMSVIIYPCPNSIGVNVAKWPPGSHFLIAKLMGPASGPSGADRTRVGPMDGPMNIAIWVITSERFQDLYNQINPQFSMKLSYSRIYLEVTTVRFNYITVDFPMIFTINAQSSPFTLKWISFILSWLLFFKLLPTPMLRKFCFHHQMFAFLSVGNINITFNRSPWIGLGTWVCCALFCGRMQPFGIIGEHIVIKCLGYVWYITNNNW